MGLNNTFGAFDGIKIKVSDFLPDGEMYVSRKTFDKMGNWFADNHPMKEMSEAEKLRFAEHNNRKGVICSYEICDYCIKGIGVCHVDCNNHQCFEGRKLTPVS